MVHCRSLPEEWPIVLVSACPAKPEPKRIVALFEHKKKSPGGERTERA